MSLSVARRADRVEIPARLLEAGLQRERRLELPGRGRAIAVQA